MQYILGKIREHWGLSLVVAASLAIRIVVLRWWNTFPYGDILNFINVAKWLGEGGYPPMEKRLPFYPFLIWLTHVLTPRADWEDIAIGIAIASSLMSLIVLYAIGRYFKFRKSALVVGLLLFSSFQPFLHFSIRGYADTSAIALLLASILAALHLERRAGYLALPFLLGAMALTRYEGLAAAVALLIIVCIRLRRQWRKLALIICIFLVTLVPYLIVMKRSERSILPQAYLAQAAQDGPEGYGAASFRDWREKYSGIWQRLGLFSAWYVPRNLYQTVRDDPLGLPYQLTETVTEPRAAIGVLATFGWLFLLLRRRIWDVVTLALPFLAVAVPVAWWAPYTRYDALVMPVMIIAAFAALHALVVVIRRGTHSAETWGRVVRGGLIAILLIMGSAVWLPRATHEATDMLKKTRFFSLAYYQAIKHARTLPGVVAFTQDDNMTKIYFPDRAVYADAILAGKPDQEAAWERLRANNVRYVVNRDVSTSLFSFLASPSFYERVHVIATYEVIQGDEDVDRAVIYELKL